MRDTGFRHPALTFETFLGSLVALFSQKTLLKLYRPYIFAFRWPNGLRR